MKKICLYLHVHQPHRIKNYNIFHIGKDSNYFDLAKNNNKNKEVFEKVAKKSYYPMNKLLHKLLVTNKKFKVNFSIFLELPLPSAFDINLAFFLL